MGGIFFCVYSNEGRFPLDSKVVEAFSNLKHRGKDYSEMITSTTPLLSAHHIHTLKKTMSRSQLKQASKRYTFIQGFHRLAVNDTSYQGSQPFELEVDKRIIRLMCNGEIYNHKELVAKYSLNDLLLSSCDAEVLLPLYSKIGIQNMLPDIDGDFSFVLTDNVESYDYRNINAYVVRDILGSKPLYVVTHAQKCFYLFVSELKSIPSFMTQSSDYIISEMPPGSIWSFQDAMHSNSDSVFTSYFSLKHFSNVNDTLSATDPDTMQSIVSHINKTITKSVCSRSEMSDVPVGILLTGGFSSSLIASIALQHCSKQNVQLVTAVDSLESEDYKLACKLVTFLENKFNKHIQHHVVCLEQFHCIEKYVPDVIKIIESFDEVAVRKGLVYYALCKFINQYTNIKVILTGECLNEIIGNEMYNQVDDKLFQFRQVSSLHHLRLFTLHILDKIASQFNIEIRQPYINRSFIEFILNIHPKFKRPMTFSIHAPPIDKYIIRKAFDDNEYCYLPKELLWKPHYSSSFSKELKHFFDMCYCGTVKDHDIHMSYTNAFVTSSNKPQSTLTKQQFVYRNVFDQFYPKLSHMVPVQAVELFGSHV